VKSKGPYAVIVLLSFLAVGVQPTLAQDDPMLNDPLLPPEPRIPGRVEGTGTHFEITDSEYINITVDSTELIKVSLESIPRMVIMHLEAAEGTTATQITLSGFPPSTTFYKYEDDYHNGVAFTTDAEGSYTYAQDLSEPHHVFIQERPSTRFIPSDTEIGTWDPVNRAYTLTTDVNETIQIDEDNMTLDGGGRTISGTGTGSGVYLRQRTGVTIKHLNVQKFTCGIYIVYSSGNTVEDNMLSNNYCGMLLVQQSHNNAITANTASNGTIGIRLYAYCNSNALKHNVANWNYFGILLEQCENSTVSGNTTNGNRLGIALWECARSNSLTGNIASHNQCAIVLYDASASTVVLNTLSNNALGMLVWGASRYNQVYNNNFLNNATQAWDEDWETEGTLYNLAPPVGGNYWSDWQPPLHPDANGDGFVDEPYAFEYAHQDNFPLVDNDSDAVSDNIEGGAPNGGDGNKDGIPDSQQVNVASLPNAVDGRYVTLASPDATRLVNVIAVANPSPWNAPAGVAFPLGFFEFTVEGVTVGGATTVTLYIPQKVDTYWKYGAEPGDPTDHWYEFLFDGTTPGAEILRGKEVILHFVDGQRGDDDLQANGRIVEPGAVGIFPRTWLGFLPSLDPDGKRLFKRGSTIPVKFRIRDWQGNLVDEAYATLAVYYLDEGAPPGDPAVESTAAGDWGDQFRYSPEDDLYIFNLSTKHPSYYDYYTYRLEVTLDDGQIRIVDFSLK